MGDIYSKDDYFNEALQNFTRDMAYGGAVRHLVDRGYTVERIEKEFHYPVSHDALVKMVDDYKANPEKYKR